MQILKLKCQVEIHVNYIDFSPGWTDLGKYRFNLSISPMLIEFETLSWKQVFKSTIQAVLDTTDTYCR